MKLLQKVATITCDEEKFKKIYVLFIQSILEQSCEVWQSSLRFEDFNNLDQFHKSAIKITLKNNIKIMTKVWKYLACNFCIIEE